MTQQTGYPSIDKPWLKYYKGNYINHELPDSNCSIEGFLRSCASGHMDVPALEYFGKIITFANFFEHVDHVAIALQQIGIKQGDMVSVCGLNTPEFVYLLYAINKIGAVSNWISLTSTIADIKSSLLATNSKLLFAVDAAVDTVRSAIEGTDVKQVIKVPISFSMPLPLQILLKLKSQGNDAATVSWKSFLKSAAGAKFVSPTIRGSDLAIIEYTGGSTGVPKGVMLSNHSLNSYYVNFNEANRAGLSSYNKGDKFLSCVPLFLAFGASSACHGPLCHGMSLVLVPDPSPNAVGKICLSSKVNHIVAGRVQIEGIFKSAKATSDLSFIRSVCYGGEPSNRSWEKDMNQFLLNHQSKASVHNGYGMTETAACILLETDLADGLLPLTNVNVKVLDADDGHELGCNENGEICLSAQTLMMGYYQKAAETLLFEENGVRWLHTGDLGKVLTDGTIHITGRIKRIYHKLSSDGIDIRVYPVRIEDTIADFAGVDRCAVIGIKDEKTAYRTIAYIRLKENVQEGQDFKNQLDSHCRQQLPDNHVPDEYRFCTDFPLTRAGKIDYLALEEMYTGS